MPLKKGQPQARRKGGRGGGPAIPLWLLLALCLALALTIFLRCRVTPKPADKNPKPGIPSQGHPPQKPRQKYLVEKMAEPPPLPESPPAGTATPPVPTPLPPGPERRVCLVLDDVGYRLDLAESAAEKLPGGTTFAVIPFLPHSETSARFLHGKGFPVILHCPMEPERAGHWKNTPGTILVGMPPAEVERILDLDLGGVPFAEGVNNHMGSLATTDRPLMDALAAMLKARGLYFLDSRTSAHTVAYESARSAGVPASFRSVFLDDMDEDGAIIHQIDLWAARSEREGAPVAIGHLRPRTLEALAFRLPYWRSKGVRLVPLREVVH
jgi:uncharacterized protein